MARRRLLRYFLSLFGAGVLGMLTWSLADTLDPFVQQSDLVDAELLLRQFRLDSTTIALIGGLAVGYRLWWLAGSLAIGLLCFVFFAMTSFFFAMGPPISMVSICWSFRPWERHGIWIGAAFLAVPVLLYGLLVEPKTTAFLHRAVARLTGRKCG